MLDCDGYPKAFIEIKNFRLEFEKSDLIDNNNLTAKVSFKIKNSASYVMLVFGHSCI